MNFVLLIFIFQLTLAQNGTHTNKNCFVFNSHNLSAYDLRSLMYLNSSYYEGRALNYGVIDFNACKYQALTKTSFAVLKTPLGNLDITNLTNWSASTYSQTDVYNEKNFTGVSIDYNPIVNDLFNKTTINGQFHILVRCNNSGNNSFDGTIHVAFGLNKFLHLYPVFNGPIGCPVYTLGSLTIFMHTYPYIFCPLMIILGAYFMVFGLKLFKVSLFIISLISIEFILANIFFIFVIQPYWAPYWGWLVIGGALIIGVILAVLITKLAKVAVILAGVLMGLILGLILYNLAFGLIGVPWLFYLIVPLFGAGCGVASIFIYEHMIIVSTSFFGAYIVVRGASVYIGHFPEEYTLARAIMNGQFKYVYQ